MFMRLMRTLKSIFQTHIEFASTPNKNPDFYLVERASGIMEL